ncbi:hypothetical protein CO992_16535 [Escherichia coli]|uniref:hypothetical protein n=1 Tax=Escherichia coli TaxID=562 RepID=UPI000BBB7F8D|nr:hypothetical protein [Escherichia coli]EFB4386831.1 hypothetical protein [Escherichia coli]EFI6663835.1 hypothetical protein [Escherichia coli]EKH4316565.1 hypothetical protein [Escherichia coli]EKP2420505.1 hypothetical protein [Escherichia coli]EKP3542436.1 hypothetical protein [Escherichia coli]
MDKDWILQNKETRRTFSRSTWVPLRAAKKKEKDNAKCINYTSEFFGCGSVAFSPQYREIAEKLSWSNIGISSTIAPYAYEDGAYSTIEQYEYNDKEPIGIHLVFELPQPVVGGRQWILNPDLIAALRLIKEGNNWVRPEENFEVVVRENLDDKGEQCLIEIKREFLLDYLAARNLALRISYYRQRVENVASLETSSYVGLESYKEERDGGNYELIIRDINDVFGGSWAMFRTWRTDIDADEDAPVMGPETNENTDYESSRGYRGGFEGIRVEGEFWRDEWIDHQGISTRVRGDLDKNLPQFIVETDGTRLASSALNCEEIGRWLWFRSSIINELLGFRGFSLSWYTAETGNIQSTSGYSIHFGINSSDLITVYAYDIARLPAWEQHIWAAHNIVPDGKVSSELFNSQVKAQPAATYAVEEIFFDTMDMLESGFRQVFNVPLFTHDIDRSEAMKHISRFTSKDLTSLLRLAKEIVRIFSDRLDVRELRKLSTHSNKEKLGSNKLLEDILAQKVGAEKAREIFGPIAGAYDMRVGDAHPTSSKIGEALKLAGIDENSSYLRQGEQLISNLGQSIWWVGKLLFQSA